MKKKVKKLVAALLVMVMVTGVLPVMQVRAAEPYFSSFFEETLYTGTKTTYSTIHSIINPTKTGKITKLKNSNTKVAKVSVYSKSGIKVEPKSEGTTNISFSYAGKKFKSKITVVKWENPCKEFKVGKKNLANQFKTKNSVYVYGKRPKTGIIKLTPKTGWKLMYITKYNVKKVGGGLSVQNETRKNVKNNSKIQLSGGSGGIYITATFQNKKTRKYTTVSCWW